MTPAIVDTVVRQGIHHFDVVTGVPQGKADPVPDEPAASRDETTQLQTSSTARDRFEQMAVECDYPVTPIGNQAISCVMGPRSRDLLGYGAKMPVAPGVRLSWPVDLCSNSRNTNSHSVSPRCRGSCVLPAEMEGLINGVAVDYSLHKWPRM
jgi:hypothetical protein